jgi:Uma2 family endonuclease
MATLTLETRRSAPPRLLAALRRAGASEDELRAYYEIPPHESIPIDSEEPLCVEDLEFLPEDSYRYELWEGKLVRRKASKPRHGLVAGRVVAHLGAYLLQHPIGEIYVADAGFRAGPGESLYCPDASYVSQERMAQASLDEFAPFAPDIAIEVRSPDNTHRQLERKARHYLAHGAQLVWVFYPRTRTVRVHRPGAPMETLQAEDLLIAEDVLPGFAVRVGDLFPK